MKIKYLYVSVLVVLSQLSFADFSKLDQQVKYFNDWSVACNNQRECFMDSLPPKSEQPAAASTDNAEEVADVQSLYLGFSRKASADSPVVLTINDWAEEEGSLEQGQSLSLKIDQQTFELGKVSAEVAENSSFEIDSKTIPELLAALQKATQAELKVGEETLAINLQGMNAGLQYFDEQQQRVDTSTALVKKGQQAFTATPPQVESLTPVISNDDEVIADDERAKLQDQVRQLPLAKDCLAKTHPEQAAEDVIEILDKDHYIFGITCVIDELNRQTLVLVAPKTNPEQAELAKFDQGADDSIITGEFNGYSASEGILLNYYSKSEMGDCGSTAEWVWNGKSFVLSSYYSMPECRGSLNSMNVWQLNVKQPEN